MATHGACLVKAQGLGLVRDGIVVGVELLKLPGCQLLQGLEILGIRFKGMQAGIVPACDAEQLVQYRATVCAAVHEVLPVAQGEGVALTRQSEILIPGTDANVVHPAPIVFEALQQHAIKRFPAVIVPQALCQLQPVVGACQGVAPVVPDFFVDRHGVEAGQYLEYIPQLKPGVAGQMPAKAVGKEAEAEVHHQGIGRKASCPFDKLGGFDDGDSFHGFLAGVVVHAEDDGCSLVQQVPQMHVPQQRLGTEHHQGSVAQQSGRLRLPGAGKRFDQMGVKAHVSNQEVLSYSSEALPHRRRPRSQESRAAPY